MSRHFWPTEDGSKHLVEHKDGRVVRGSIFKGYWYVNGEEWTVPMLEERGWIGVRTPFDEESERAAFEKFVRTYWVVSLDRDEDDDSQYADADTQELFDTWLAAVRHERGP